MSEIAVVIPAYNAAQYLRETVASVINSQHVTTEIVIVDDGSKDDTVAVARRLALEHPEFIEVIEQENAGNSVARNTGFAHTSAPYVCFLDADDRLRPDALAALNHLLQKNPDFVAAYGDVAYIDEASEPLSFPARKSPKPSGNLLVRILAGNLIDTPGAVLFRSSAVKRAGGFKAGLRRSQDWEFYVRIAQQGPIVAYNQIVLDYRLHTSSLSHESSTADTFEEALSLAFTGVRQARVLPERLVDRLEARRRASTLRLIAIRSHSLSSSTLSAMLRLCLSSRFDARVLQLTAKTLMLATKRRLLSKMSN